MKKTLDITLEKMTYGGDAIGHLQDNKVIFVRFGIPGERVQVEEIDIRKSFSRGKILEIVSPSPRRDKPKCIHFGFCGGCHYQHLRYLDQATIKQEIVREQLVHIGGFTTLPHIGFTGSVAPWNYRNSLQFHLNPKGKLGFKGVNPSEVIKLEECHLPLLAVNKTWPMLNFKPGSPLDRIELRQGLEEKQILHLHTGFSQIPEFKLDFPISIILESNHKKTVITGDRWIFMEVKGRKFRVSAGSFFQVNTPMAGMMVDYLLSNLDLSSEKNILDLFCGVGLFSAFLAPLVHTCIGVESSSEACQDYIFNLKGLSNVSLFEGHVEEIVPYLESKANLVIVDPPRTGIARNGLDGILNLEPDQIAYISCDPATLARDLKYLQTSYHLESIQLFDLFPQTYHVETVVLMSRAKK
jgi:23S rRNA (uracil1939-C5)-methyltransferase